VACDAFAEVEEQLVLLQSDLDVAGEFQSVAAFVARLEILLGLQLEQALTLCDIKFFLLLDSFEAMGKVLLIRVRIQIGHGLLRSATLFLLIAAGSGECILFLSVLYSVHRNCARFARKSSPLICWPRLWYRSCRASLFLFHLSLLAKRGQFLANTVRVN